MIFIFSPSLLERIFKTKKYVSLDRAKGFVIDLRVQRIAEGNPSKTSENFTLRFAEPSSYQACLSEFSKPKNTFRSIERRDLLLTSGFYGSPETVQVRPLKPRQPISGGFTAIFRNTSFWSERVRTGSYRRPQGRAHEFPLKANTKISNPDLNEAGVQILPSNKKSKGLRTLLYR